MDWAPAVDGFRAPAFQRLFDLAIAAPLHRASRGGDATARQQAEVTDDATPPLAARLAEQAHRVSLPGM